MASPDNPAFLDSLGWVRFRRGDVPGALPHLERAYRIFPDAEIASHWGELLWVSGKQAEARALWARSLARSPDSKPLRATIERLTGTKMDPPEKKSAPPPMRRSPSSRCCPETTPRLPRVASHAPCTRRVGCGLVLALAVACRLPHGATRGDRRARRRCALARATRRAGETRSLRARTAASPWPPTGRAFPPAAIRAEVATPRNLSLDGPLGIGGLRVELEGEDIAHHHQPR